MCRLADHTSTGIVTRQMLNSYVPELISADNSKSQHNTRLHGLVRRKLITGTGTNNQYKLTQTGEDEAGTEMDNHSDVYQDWKF